MKWNLKLGSGIAIFGFFFVVAYHNSNLSAKGRRGSRHRGFSRIYGQEDTFARTRRTTRRQRRFERSRLRSLRYQSYNGSAFNFSYGRSGRYGYSFYIDRPTYYSSYYQPWFIYPYAQSRYYRGYYGYPGYYSYYYPGYSYRSWTARSYGYGYGYRYPGYYRGYGFGYAPY